MRQSETQADVAYRKLRRDIIRGVRVAGERLRIEKLKSIYGIGPTPLREALHKISLEGLVVAQENKGFSVATLDPSEFDDLNKARIAIEKAALELSLQLGDQQWEAQVVACSYIMAKEDLALKELPDSVPDSWTAANTQFHQSLVSACGSSWLLRVRENLHDLCERYLRASIYQKIGKRDLDLEHKALADAVLSRDKKLACTLIEQHFQQTALTLHEAYDNPYYQSEIK